MKKEKILTEKQESLLKTCRTVLERCLQNKDDVAKIPRFAELVQSLNAIVVDIDTALAAKESSRDTKTITKLKNDSVDDLIIAVDKLAKVAGLIAKDKHNDEWVSKAKKGLKKHTFKTSPHNLLAMAQGFADFLTAIDADTRTYYGIDADDIADIESYRTQAKNLNLKKELAADQKTLDNQMVATLFDKLTELKLDMDTLSERFEKKAPTFFAVYQTAKIIPIKTGIRGQRAKKETPNAKGNTGIAGSNHLSASNDLHMTTTNT